MTVALFIIYSQSVSGFCVACFAAVRFQRIHLVSHWAIRHTIEIMTTTFRRCWAEPLGDCSGTLSREHYISECLFPSDKVFVRGFSWCRDEHREIGLSGLTAKILCEKHNNELSEVDTGAKEALHTLRDAMDLFMRRDRLRERRWTIQHFTINILLLERWCLKTLIDINYQGQWRMDSDSNEVGIPSKELVKIAFGRKPFDGHGGLYLVAKSGEEIRLREGGFTIGATTDQEGRLVAGRFALWGFPFVLSLLTTPIQATNGAALLRGEVKQWFQTHDDKLRKVKSHLVTFTYPQP